MADEAMWKRPKADDDEKDLLRQQEEFLKAGRQLSVKLVDLKYSASATRDAPTEAKSRFSNLRQSGAKRDLVSTSQGSGDVINPVVKDKIRETKGKLEDMVQNIPVASSNIILGNIMERKFDIEKFEFNYAPAAVELGFPEVFGSDDVSLIEKVCLNETCFLFLCQLYHCITLCRRPMVSRAYFCKKFQS